MTEEVLKSAISIRQPYVEEILLGLKWEEYRTRYTDFRGRVYLYASWTLAAPVNQKVGDRIVAELPRGVIVGSVEIVGCRVYSGDGWNGYAYMLRLPRRYKLPINVVSKGRRGTTVHPNGGSVRGYAQPLFWKVQQID